jgi:hypothetical protein
VPTPKPTYTKEELERSIQSYFDQNPQKPTVTGLAHFLGFESRQSLYDYKCREETSYTIKRAILKIESIHEERLYDPNSTGSIFWLKNRDWSDKQSHEHSGDVKLTDLTVTIVNKPNGS